MKGNGKEINGMVKVEILQGIGEIEPKTGTYTWKNGDKYEGQFKKMKRDGIGKQTLHSGNYYEGEFRGRV